MAKKEKSGKESATVAARAAEKVGREILAQNKTLNQVYVTTDGIAFAERNDAQNHARTLQNREVFNIRREEVPAPAAVKEPEPESATETDNSETEKDNAEADV